LQLSAVILVCQRRKWVNEDTAKALCKLLEEIATTAIKNSQNVVALEAVLKKDKNFETAYRIELAKTQFGSTAADMKTAIGKLQSALSWH
jgi:hypothetical protein